jgi:uncharacterized protein YsxB (DUF464 family)
VTHVIENAFTYAIVLGCTDAVTNNIQSRINSLAKEGAYQSAHPMLLAGIFAEIERQRHDSLAEGSSYTLERRITELSDSYHNSKSPTEKLDTTTLLMDTKFLQNGLESWKTQLEAMIYQLESLSGSCHYTTLNDSYSRQVYQDRQQFQYLNAIAPIVYDNYDRDMVASILYHPITLGNFQRASGLPTPHVQRQLNYVTKKIKDRLTEIANEYDENIRTCRIRVDGMGMGTSIGIATDSRLDGKSMKKLTILSILLLPSICILVS